MAEFDLSLDKLMKSFTAGANAATQGKIYKRALTYLGNTATGYAKMLTPVKTGTMRRAWKLKVEDKKAQLSNPTEYAVYVNDGHRIVRGGKTVGYVSPQHMLEKALDQAEARNMRLAQMMVLEDLKKEMATYAAWNK